MTVKPVLGVVGCHQASSRADARGSGVAGPRAATRHRLTGIEREEGFAPGQFFPPPASENELGFRGRRLGRGRRMSP